MNFANRNDFFNTLLKDRIKDGKIDVSRDEFLKTIKELKLAGFNYLDDLTGIDNHPHKPRFHALYVLTNMTESTRVMIKVLLNEEDLHIPTITDIWPGANWLEREAYDMFGIIFDGHPNLTRILAAPNQSWSGKGTEDYPLRKDFNIIQRPGDDLTEKFEKK